MKIYFATLGKSEPVYLSDAGFKNQLCSYHYFKKDTATIKALKERGVEIFMDSGAFSAANSNSVIDINAYSKFLVEYGIDIYVSLDVIGNAEKTFENWEYQNREYKLNCIPTFHIGEDFDWLQKYLDAGCHYIALGGMVGSDNVEGWLNRTWKFLLNENANIKIHGFGMTTADLIYKYPWYSFDSSSFKSGRRFGRIPQFSGKRLYNISEDAYRVKRLKTHADTEEIYANNKDLWYNTMSESGCHAYNDMVKYLSQFDKRNEFINQLDMFDVLEEEEEEN